MLIIRTIALCMSVLFSTGVLATEQKGTDSVKSYGHWGDKVENRLDRRGDRIDYRLDRKGDRINNRLDRKADRASVNGHQQRADRLDRRGNRIEHRLDIRGDRINKRLDRIGNRVQNRTNRI